MCWSKSLKLGTHNLEIFISVSYFGYYVYHLQHLRDAKEEGAAERVNVERGSSLPEILWPMTISAHGQAFLAHHL